MNDTALTPQRWMLTITEDTYLPAGTHLILEEKPNGDLVIVATDQPEGGLNGA